MDLLLTLLLALSSTTAVANAPCFIDGRAVHVATVIASASFWDNFLGRKGSVQKELVEIVNKAHTKILAESAEPASCASCLGGSVYEIALSSIPTKFQSEYADAKLCADRLEATIGNPIHIAPRGFADVDSFVSWYSDLSRGKGKQGEYLYKQCDGSCSPQYFVRIQFIPDRILVTTDVICGHARDKEDDEYTVTAAIQSGCRLTEEELSSDTANTK